MTPVPAATAGRWSREEDEALLMLYRDPAVTVETIARVLGRTPGAVQRRVAVLRAAGAPVSRGVSGRERRERVLELLAGGLRDHRVIAREAGVSVSYLQVLMSRMRAEGIDVPRQREAAISPEERAELVRLWNDDTPITEIARRLGRPEGKITQLAHAAREAGVDLQPRTGEWRETERAQLVERWASGDSVPEIASALGRSETAVRGQLARLHAEGQAPQRRPRWSPAETRVLLTMQARGDSHAAIAAALGRTPRSVEGRIAVLRARGESLPARR